MLMEPTKIVGLTRQLISSRLSVRTDLVAHIVDTQTDLVGASADHSSRSPDGRKFLFSGAPVRGDQREPRRE
jgi:hypothetical protein